MTDPYREPEPASWSPPPAPPAAPGYGPPPPPGYGYYQPRPPTNTLAILALVFAIVFSPAGIVLGIMARKQIARSGEDGYGLATAGLWVGVVLTALTVLYIVFMIVVLVTALS